MTVHRRPCERNRIESKTRAGCGLRPNEGGDPCRKCDNKALDGLRFRVPVPDAGRARDASRSGTEKRGIRARPGPSRAIPEALADKYFGALTKICAPCNPA